MIDVKLIRKPKGGGGVAVGNASGSSLGETLVKEAAHAVRADMAEQAKEAEYARGAGQASRAENAAHANEAAHAVQADKAAVAHDIDADSPVNGRFLSKVSPDTAQKLITFLQGIAFKASKGIDADGVATLAKVIADRLELTGFEQGTRGFAAWLDEKKRSHVQVDFFEVLGKAVFHELEVRRMVGIGGDQMQSAAASVLLDAIPIVEGGKTAGWKCHLKTDDGTTQTLNTWVAGDQAYCHISNLRIGTSTNAANRAYWRVVSEVAQKTEAEEAYIIITNMVPYYHKDMTDTPQAGDSVVQFGYNAAWAMAHGIDPSKYANRMNVRMSMVSDDTGPVEALYRAISGFDYSVEQNAVKYLSSDRMLLRSKNLRWLTESGEAIPNVVHIGDWPNGGTTAHIYEAWQHSGATWLCLRDTTDEPSEDSRNWSIYAAKGDPGVPGASSYTHIRYSDDGGKTFTAAKAWQEPLTKEICPDVSSFALSAVTYLSPVGTNFTNTVTSSNKNGLVCMTPIPCTWDIAYEIAEGYSIFVMFYDGNRQYLGKNSGWKTGSGIIQRQNQQYITFAIKKNDDSVIADIAETFNAAKVSIKTADFGGGRNLYVTNTQQLAPAYNWQILDLTHFGRSRYSVSFRADIPDGVGTTLKLGLYCKLMNADGSTKWEWGKYTSISIGADGRYYMEDMPVRDGSLQYYLILYLPYNMTHAKDEYVGMTIYDVKVEQGTECTPWTPAPATLQFGLTPGKYMGVAVSDSPYPPMSVGDYTWSKVEGNDGRGIASVVRYYGVSGSATIEPATYSGTPPTLSPTNKYMWSYDLITYSDGTTSQTKHAITGVYGDAGLPGAPGNSAAIRKLNTYLRQYGTGTWAQYSVAGFVGDWISINNTPDINVGDLVYIEGVISDRGNIKCYLFGEVLSKTSSTVKIKTTAFVVDGENGTPGSDAYTVSLTPDTIVLDTNDEGNVTDVSNATAEVKAYKGATAVTPTSVKIKSMSHCTAVVAGSTVRITAVGTDSEAKMSYAGGSVDVDVTIDGQTFTRRLLFTVNITKLSSKIISTNKEYSVEMTSMKATNTLMQKSIGDLKVAADHISAHIEQSRQGVYNLLKDTKTLRGDCMVGSGVKIADRGVEDFSVAGAAATRGYIDVVAWNGITDVKPDTYYSLSFYARGAGSFHTYFSPDCCAEAVGSQGQTSTDTSGHIAFTLSNNPNFYWVTWKTKPDVNGRKTVIPARVFSGSSIFMYGVCLVESPMPSAWVPYRWAPQLNYISNPLAVTATEDTAYEFEDINDATFRKVKQVHYSGGDFQLTWKVANYETLNNYPVTFYAIIKYVDSDASAMFGGFNDQDDYDGTYTYLDTKKSKYIDLGNGWRKYYTTFFNEDNRIWDGHSKFGICNVTGTIQVYAVGVVLGEECPDWNVEPMETTAKKSGWDLYSHKFLITSDNFAVQNQSGATTFLVDKDGKVNAELIKALEVWANIVKTGDIDAQNARFKNLLIEGNSKFNGTLEGVAGSFKTLRCVNKDGVEVGCITFGKEGDLTLEGDIYSQGYNSAKGRAYRFYANNLWCRGVFGHRQKTVVVVKGTYMHVDSKHNDGNWQSIPLDYITTQGGIRVYQIPLFLGVSNNDWNAMPVDIVVFNTTAEYYYSFIGQLNGKEWRVINGNNNQKVNVAAIDGWKAIQGGQILDFCYINPELLNPVQNSEQLGAGVLWNGFIDLNWVK